MFNGVDQLYSIRGTLCYKSTLNYLFHSLAILKLYELTSFSSISYLTTITNHESCQFYLLIIYLDLME